MRGMPYSKVTRHGSRILKILQDHEDRHAVSVGGRKHVVSRPLVGAEIGTWRGKNAATLLSRCPQLKLFMIDFWGNGEVNDGPSQKYRQIVEAIQETNFAFDRRIILSGSSPAVAASFENGYFDFVFVDGGHTYDKCLADLEGWWPKVKSGGLLMGHDIDHPAHDVPGQPKYKWGVRKAVDEFVGNIGIDVDVYPPPETVFAIRKP